jgi:glucokinase
MILCGDVGGTKTTLALFPRERPSDPVDPFTYASRTAAGLDELVTAFLARAPTDVDAACFGIAGPVVGDRVATTNLPWVIEGAALAARLGGRPVFLLNDLEALAHGVSLVPAEQLAVLNPGTPRPGGNAAVIAVGTGLGEAGLLWDGRRHLPLASEGGHRDFAPRTEREVALLRHLQGRFDHVSTERVLSGPGLVHVLEFLRDVEGQPVPPALAAALAGEDAPAAIAAAALTGKVAIAVAALDLFAAIYGAEAGNLALTFTATGGVWVGGGIAPRILAKLADGTFRDAFLAKGRFRGFLEHVAVRVILEEHTALRGAARYAAGRLGSDG